MKLFCKRGHLRDSANLGQHSRCIKCSNELNRQKISQRTRQTRYGISEVEYNELFKEQEGKCAICGLHQSNQKRGMSVDHDHKTGQIRGLLCNNCNRCLGLLHDDPTLLRKAEEYLIRALKGE